MLGPIRPQVIFSQSKLSKQHSRTIEKWLMWHFPGRGDKWKEEISHVLVFCVPRLPSSLLCFSTWEDVLCGRPHLGSLAIWLPDGLANARSRRKTGGEVGGGISPSLPPFLTAVLPEAVFLLLGGPSFTPLDLTGLQSPHALFLSFCTRGW